MLEVIRMTATRIPKGGTAGARAAMARVVAAAIAGIRARGLRGHASIAEAARFTPGLWLLNRISPWLDAAGEVAFAVRLPEDYVQVYSKFFDLLEAGDADGACAHMSEYFERHDSNMSKALAVLG